MIRDVRAWLKATFLATRGPARHFLIWLRGSGIDVHTVDGNVVHRFLRHNCDCRPQDCMGHAFYAWRKRRSSPELMRFIRFLEQTGRIHTPGDLDDNPGLLDEFLGELQTAGYAQSTIDKRRYGCRNLIAWLHLSRISLNRIDANALETFLQRDFICSIPSVFYGREPGHNSRWYATTLRGFLRFLVDTGRIETMVPCVDAVDDGLGEFRSWLHRNRGIGEGRVEKLVKLISVVLPEIGDNPGQYDAALIRNVMLSRLRLCRGGMPRRSHVERHVGLKQKLGYKFTTNERMLLSHAEFADDRNDQFTRIDTIVDWASKAKSRRGSCKKLHVVRAFAVWMQPRRTNICSSSPMAFHLIA